VQSQKCSFLTSLGRERPQSQNCSGKLLVFLMGFRPGYWGGGNPGTTLGRA